VKAQHELKSLHMTKDNLDDFISQFQNLANKAGYDLDQRVTLDLFQNRTNALTHCQDLNAMDLGHTRACATMTEDEKTK